MRNVFTSVNLVHMIQSHYGAATPDLPSFSGRVASWIGVKSNSPIPSTSSPGCLRGSSSNQERYDSETYQVITPSKPFLISLKSYKTKTLFLAQNQYWPISSPAVLAWSLAAGNTLQYITDGCTGWGVLGDPKKRNRGWNVTAQYPFRLSIGSWRDVDEQEFIETVTCCSPPPTSILVH